MKRKPTRCLIGLLLLATGAAAQYICAPWSKDTFIVSINGAKFPCTMSTLNTERVTIRPTSNQYFLLSASPGQEMLVIRNGIIQDTAQRAGSNDYVIRGNRIDMTPQSGAFDLAGKLKLGDRYRFIYTTKDAAP